MLWCNSCRVTDTGRDAVMCVVYVCGGPTGGAGREACATARGTSLRGEYREYLMRRHRGAGGGAGRGGRHETVSSAASSLLGYFGVW